MGEIIVVDDGSTDGTAEALDREFGSRIVVLRQANAGVSAARNAGLSRASGSILAFLDSDETWEPEKVARQLAWLDARPDHGMVLCDVRWFDAAGRFLGVFRRRRFLPRDGEVLSDVLMQPALIPSTVMMRRAVYEDVGGFDESLPTAEDIDLHIRIAARWRIGVLEEPLVNLVRGQGLSSAPRSCLDYVGAMERAIARVGDRIDAGTARRAIAACYARNARSLIHDGRWREAGELSARAWAAASSVRERAALCGLVPLAARQAVARAIRGRAGSPSSGR